MTWRVTYVREELNPDSHHGEPEETCVNTVEYSDDEELSRALRATGEEYFREIRSNGTTVVRFKPVQDYRSGFLDHVTAYIYNQA